MNHNNSAYVISLSRTFAFTGTDLIFNPLLYLIIFISIKHAALFHYIRTVEIHPRFHILHNPLTSNTAAGPDEEELQLKSLTSRLTSPNDFKSVFLMNEVNPVFTVNLTFL